MLSHNVQKHRKVSSNKIVSLTKVSEYSDLFLIWQTETYDTEINYLSDFVSRIFKDMQYLQFFYLDQTQFF